MYKYFLCPILICLLISSCANQRNSSDYWNKKKNMTVCDCVDMAKDLFTEVIDDYDKNPALSIDSIMKGKEADWKPLWKRCEEETNFGLSIEEEAEQCQSFKEFRILMDSITRLAINWETHQNNSSSELCDCLSEAQSEEEAQACAPDKSMEDLEAIYNDCLNDWAEMDLEAMEEMPDMEEYEEWPEEEGYKSACDCLREVMDSEEHVDRAPAGCEWMDNLDDDQLMEELKDCPEMAAMFEIEISDIEEMEEALEMMEALEEEDEWEKEWELMSPQERIALLEEELYRLVEPHQLLLSDIEYFELEINELKDSLQYFESLPDFDLELCDCIFQEGIIAREESGEEPCLPDMDPEVYDELYDRLSMDCQRHYLTYQDLSHLLEDLQKSREDLHLTEMQKYELEMQIEELEVEIQMEIEIAELLEAEHNPEGSDYDFNPDLAFKAQEIFSALESEDFDLFLDLVKVDTVDFFYWRIPSADFNRKNLEGMSIEIENMAGDSTTVQAMHYLSMFQSYDMNLLTTNWGFDRAAGWFGSCDRIVFKENTDGERDFTQYENVSFIFCPNEQLLECIGPGENIEQLMHDPYRLNDALYCACIMQDQLWFVFDKPNQKLIGIYDWQWSP